ncbi:MAG TPA: dihydrolipoamide acetyltransferase family protein [Candidatus Dormibacteraeota bacterium]|nr:dihydrolipoamide acetyltransferase family protein [Candidatus Dormibacteraeota bacterium]
MARDILMPQMGYDMTEGTIVRWVKRVGDRVHKGDIVAEIETDKATVEIEAFDSGVLLRTLAAPGQTVPVGQPIATLGEAGEVLPEVPAAAPADPAVTPSGAPGSGPSASAAASSASAGSMAAAPSRPASSAGPGAPSATPRAAAINDLGPPAAETGAGGDAPASPLARRLAARLGVDLSRVRGSGPGGRIVREDVEAAAGAGSPGAAAPPGTTPPSAATLVATAAPAPSSPAGPGPTPEGAEDIQPSRLRQTIARRMAESKRSAPHFYVSVEINADALIAARQNFNTGEVKVSVNDFLLRALALAAQEHPEVNAAYLDGTIRRFTRVDVGMAVATDNGLLSPALLDCAAKSIPEIAREAADLVARARAGHLRPEEYGGGTVTLSNLGMYGVDAFLAIINPPQALILSVGAAADRVVPVKGKPAIAKVMTAWAAADHRVLDGADVARFMSTLRQLLEDPDRLLA